MLDGGMNRAKRLMQTPPPARKVLKADGLAASGRDFSRSANADRQFFESIKLSNGSFKTTYEHRLDDLNAIVIPHIRAGPAPHRILDVGISSGVSTLEWSTMLANAEIPHRMFGIDLLVNAPLITFFGWFDVLVDNAGWPLQFAFGELTLRAWLRRRDWFTGYWLLVGAAHVLYRILRRQANLNAATKTTTLPAWVQVDELRLVSANLREAGIQVSEENVLDEPPPEWIGTASVVRAANVLNRASFPTDKISGAIAHLARRLRLDGLLIVCRTEVRDGSNHGSIYRRRDDHLELVATLGSGSEIHEIIETVRV